MDKLYGTGNLHMRSVNYIHPIDVSSLGKKNNSSEKRALEQQVKSLQIINRRLKHKNSLLHAALESVDKKSFDGLYWRTCVWLTKNPSVMKEIGESFEKEFAKEEYEDNPLKMLTMMIEKALDDARLKETD